jgi:hypothetical protein
MFAFHARTMRSVIALATALLLAPASGWAASSASSASSEASSASVGSVSTSFETSSNSSTGGGKVAAGEYRVIQVAAAPTGGMQRVTLRAQGDVPTGAMREFVLVLPAVTAEKAGLAAGSAVTAREQAYGMQFAAGEPRQAFFLVLHDENLRELQMRPVTL